MYKYLARFLLLVVLNSPSFYALSEGTSGITGDYEGEYRITMLGCPGICSAAGYITLGWGIKDVPWVWDFDTGSATLEGTTLSVGFNYEIQDIGNIDTDENIVYFTDNGDGTYTLDHGFQIFNPNVGSPRKETSTTFAITQEGNELTFKTIDIELDGSQDGVPGTQITDVFPMTVSPVMDGWARLSGGDSTGDGISDSAKITFGLNPNISDTDGDNINDIDELGDDFENPLDSDNDGIIDALEYGDAAADPQQAKGLPLLSGVAGLAITTDQLSGETVDISVTGNWKLTDISSALMIVDIDNTTSTEETEFSDSTLGAPGLNYIYGQITVTAYPQNLNSTTENEVTLLLQYSSQLPDNDQLLIYTLTRQDDDSELFTLMSATQYERVDDHTLAINIAITDTSNLNVDSNSIKIVIAPVENSLGGIDRNQSGGGIGLQWLILLFILSMIKKIKITTSSI